MGDCCKKTRDLECAEVENAFVLCVARVGMTINQFRRMNGSFWQS
jgi:hypothetical protein